MLAELVPPQIGRYKVVHIKRDVTNEKGVSSNNEVYYAATHSARQPEIALNSLVGVGAMTKTKKSIERVVLRPALYGPKTADLYQFNLGRSVFTVINYYGTKSGIHSESSWRLAAIWLKRVKGGVLRGPKEAP